MERTTRPQVRIEESSTDSSDPSLSLTGSQRARTTAVFQDNRHTSPLDQEHGRTRICSQDSVARECHDHAHNQFTSMSNTSLSSSIHRFREDFDGMKCKIKIFGESLKLCTCIANDFQGKMKQMERRLTSLEKRHGLNRSESNYSAIIQKNRRLSSKTMQDARKLQMCGTEEEMRVVAGRICRNYLSGMWKVVQPDQLNFRRISGGLSNFLYYVALPDDVSKLRMSVGLTSSDDAADESRGNMMEQAEPRKVLLRIYGQVHGERAMDAIVTESVIFTLLSERRLGPRLHGVFSGGRIEEYIPARPLLTKELSDPALSMKIAEKMAAIHSMDVPLSKGPHWLWKTMGNWLKTAMAERLSGAAAKNAEEEAIVKRLRSVDFEKEIEWVKKYVATVDSPVVFCHNDMQEGNILMLEDTAPSQTPEYEEPDYCPSFESPSKLKSTQTYAPLVEDGNTRDSMSSHISDTGEPKLVLIDFEYCAYNYRGFDIANHFQEWCYDYTNPVHPFYYEMQENAPTLEQKEIFIREYLKHYQTNCQSGFDSPRTHQEEPSIDAVNHLLEEVDSFTVVVHIFWALWSVVNASKSQIPFGYWEFAMARVENYLQLKQDIIKKDKYGLPQKRKICEVDI